MYGFVRTRLLIIWVVQRPVTYRFDFERIGLAEVLHCQFASDFAVICGR